MSRFQRFQRVEAHHERDGQRLRSGFEAKVWDQLKINQVTFEYEPSDKTIGYVIPARQAHYHPDFYIPCSNIYIEVKGLLDTDDRKKHLLIKEQYGDRYDIRFVFWSSNTPIYPGSKTTCGMWADANRFKWADRKVPDSWFKPKGKPPLKKK